MSTCETERDDITVLQPGLCSLFLFLSSPFPFQRLQLKHRETGGHVVRCVHTYTKRSYHWPHTAALTSLSTIFNLPSALLAASYKKKKEWWFYLRRHTHWSEQQQWRLTNTALTLLPWVEYFFTESESPWQKRRSTFSYSTRGGGMCC